MDYCTLIFDENKVSNSDEWVQDNSIMSANNEKLRLYARGDCNASGSGKIPLPKLDKKRTRGKKVRKSPKNEDTTTLTWNREISISSEDVISSTARPVKRIPLPKPKTVIPPKDGRIPLPCQMSVFFNKDLNIKTNQIN